MVLACFIEQFHGAVHGGGTFVGRSSVGVDHSSCHPMACLRRGDPLEASGDGW